ncbi:MAG: hypothetical protein NTY14_04825 [Candidatus Omnitrophica bacterium]|nr:hypothetical protein [Candidatus Omnitrophota bacterium]
MKMETPAETRLEMELLYNDSIKMIHEGRIVKGKIVALKTKEVLVDVGFMHARLGYHCPGF